jgi:hypothetical protein
MRVMGAFETFDGLRLSSATQQPKARVESTAYCCCKAAELDMELEQQDSDLCRASSCCRAN